MCALFPSLFPNFGWPSTAGYESYYLGGENLNDMFLDVPVPETYEVAHHQNEHQIFKIRNRFWACSHHLPYQLVLSWISMKPNISNNYKKLSISATVSRGLKYIPELEEQVKKLLQKKEELLVRVSGQRDIEHYVKPQPKTVACYVSTVSATKLGDNEVMVQISSSKIHNFSISTVLTGLEEDGFVLVDISSSRSQGERLFYALHLQMDNMDNHYKINCEELSERMLHLYEKI
ncbi:transcription factor ORG2-like [Raphanus sativus]|uniref:Transcription factor ORG2-like n=1 Tax=Raphanus sativus TaxID=3726 RepID=A0A9W3DKB4_RAPSA|nr:transcription factor ORG2-like [Raphanus sativus]